MADVEGAVGAEGLDVDVDIHGGSIGASAGTGGGPGGFGKSTSLPLPLPLCEASTRLPLCCGARGDLRRRGDLIHWLSQYCWSSKVSE